MAAAITVRLETANRLGSSGADVQQGQDRLRVGAPQVPVERAGSDEDDVRADLAQVLAEAIRLVLSSFDIADCNTRMGALAEVVLEGLAAGENGDIEAVGADRGQVLEQGRRVEAAAEDRQPQRAILAFRPLPGGAHEPCVGPGTDVGVDHLREVGEAPRAG